MLDVEPNVATLAHDPHKLLAYGILLDLMLECCLTFVVEGSTALRHDEAKTAGPAWCRQPIRPAQN